MAEGKKGEARRKGGEGSGRKGRGNGHPPNENPGYGSVHGSVKGGMHIGTNDRRGKGMKRSTLLWGSQDAGVRFGGLVEASFRPIGSSKYCSWIFPACMYRGPYVACSVVIPYESEM